MDGHPHDRDLLVEAVELASSPLEAGEELAPMMIVQRWGDRWIERFDHQALSDAKAKFGSFLRAAAGDESCALVYLGHVGDREEAILVERGSAGDGGAQVFVQRFRPRRSRFRGFKLVGELEPVGTLDSAP
jgi:hypothetical protein